MVKKGSSFVLMDYGIINRDSFAEYQVKAFIDRNGVDCGFPLNDESAIKEVDRQLKSGITHIIIAWTAFWFFDSYKSWHEYMCKTFKVVHQSKQLVVFDLRSSLYEK